MGLIYFNYLMIQGYLFARGEVCLKMTLAVAINELFGFLKRNEEADSDKKRSVLAGGW